MACTVSAKHVPVVSPYVLQSSTCTKAQACSGGQHAARHGPREVEVLLGEQAAHDSAVAGNPAHALDPFLLGGRAHRCLVCHRAV